MMAKSLKLFQFVQKIHRAVGIQPLQPNQKWWHINLRNAIFLISSIQLLVTSIAFLMLEAQSMLDYGFGFFLTLCVINTIVIYVLFIWQFGNTLEFINNCEELIQTSKFHFVF